MTDNKECPSTAPPPHNYIIHISVTARLSIIGFYSLQTVVLLDYRFTNGDVFHSISQHHIQHTIPLLKGKTTCFTQKLKILNNDTTCIKIRPEAVTSFDVFSTKCCSKNIKFSKINRILIVGTKLT